MVFNKEDEVLNKVLHQEKGYGAKKFIKELPNKNWSLSSLKKLLIKTDQTSTVDRKPGSGKKRTTWTAQKVDSVQELVLSQESASGTHKTIPQIAQETGISKTSVHRIMKWDFKLQCFRKRKAQDLTAANKFAGLFRAKQLVRKYPEHTIPFIWFSDENFLLLLRQ